MSRKLTPIASTSTSSWPGPGSGSGSSRSSSTSGPPFSVTTIARKSLSSRGLDWTARETNGIAAAVVGGPTASDLCHSLDDRVLHGPECGRGPRRNADLGVDVLDVVVGGLGRDVEAVGDLTGREPLRRKAQDIDLTSCEPTRIVRPLARGASRLAMAAGDEHSTARPRLDRAI